MLTLATSRAAAHAEADLRVALAEAMGRLNQAVENCARYPTPTNELEIQFIGGQVEAYRDAISILGHRRFMEDR